MRPRRPPPPSQVWPGPSATIIPARHHHARTDRTAFPAATAEPDARRQTLTEPAFLHPLATSTAPRNHAHRVPWQLSPGSGPGPAPCHKEAIVSASTDVLVRSAGGMSRRERAGRAIMWLAVLAAAGAAGTALLSVLDAGSASKVAETWRLCGLVVFTGPVLAAGIAPASLQGRVGTRYRQQARIGGRGGRRRSPWGHHRNGDHYRLGRRPHDRAHRRLHLLPRMDRHPSPAHRKARRAA